VALANLEQVFGAELEPAARRQVARECFESLGVLLADFARLPRIDRAELDRRVTYEGLERYRSARAAGKGVLYLAAHYGSWELIPHAQAVLGMPMAFIVRPADNPRVEAIIKRYREARGNVAIGKRQAIGECLRRLRRGETVGILIDQHVPAERGVPVDFLGQRTHATGALAALALRTGAPVLPVFIRREPGGRRRIVFAPEVELVRTGDRERDLEVNTARFLREVERFVRERPGHWLWLHRRFRDPGLPAYHR
jgi:KDO2-lipid IV(A) lauroyltransferase